MRILFFSLFSDIWQHSVPESFLMTSFRDAGHSVFTVGCGGALSYCHVMESRGGAEENCSSCIRSCNILKKYSCPVESFFIKDYVSNNVIKDVLKSMLENKVSDLEKSYDGIPFGRFAIYDTVLRFKKQNSEIATDEERAYFNLAIEGAVKTYYSIKNISQKNNFDRVVIYSPQYSVNQSVAYFFEQSSVPVYFIEAGTNINKRLETLRCWRWSTYHLVNPLLDVSDLELGNMNFSTEDLQCVTNHFVRLIEGKSHMVYSKSLDGEFDFYERFHKAKGKKVILATMSSFDEAYSAYLSGLFPYKKANSSVYENQVKWIEDIILNSSRFSDSFFVIRVHPRDFPNKREGGVSDQGKKLSTLFSVLPDNVVVNFPSDGISIYNLLGYVDVLTTGWSVTAVEAGMLGIPVVTYDQNMPSYPKSIMFTGETKSEYFKNIRLALDRGWTFDQVVRSYKWLSLNHNFGSLKIVSGISSYETNLKHILLRIIDKILKIFFNFSSDLVRNLYLSKVDGANLRKLVHLIELGENKIIDLSIVKKELFEECVFDEISYRSQLRQILKLIKSKNTGGDNLPPVWEKIQKYLNG